MRVFNVQPAARPTYYDRNPSIAIAGTELASIAPHTVTQRFSYTVPVGKKAWADFTYLEVFCSAAPTTAGRSQLRLLYTPSGGGQALLDQINFAGNVVNTVAEREAPSLGELNPGDNIVATTTDFSTGGTRDYAIVFKKTEFDV